MSTLKGKKVLLTGGASGIGKIMGRLALERGAELIIWDINSAGIEETKKEFSVLGKVHGHTVDISSAEQVKAGAGQVKKDIGTVDILINNAGIVSDARLVKMDLDQWQKVIDVNLKGVFICAQAASKVLIDQGEGGAILNTSSVVGLYGNFGQSNYVASKAGVIGMTKTWAKELGKYNIRVNAVAPGFMETEIIKSMPEKVINLMKEKTLLQRLGKPDDIANAFLYLASDEGSYVTGTVLSVDGGIII